MSSMLSRPLRPSGPSQRLAGWIFLVAWLALLAAEVLRVYWIMPFPGSQTGDTIGAAYALHRGIWALRILLGGAAVWAALRLFRQGRWVARLATGLAVAALAVLAYQTNGPMSADVMFQQPKTLAFSSMDAVAPETLVVGVALTDASGHVETRAYPVQFIGYHHQVRDVVAGRPVMITYCTVCRSGRAFSPIVDGQPDTFRLVGMDHWNAMFEDSRTGSWWRQATGEAVAGPKKARDWTRSLRGR